MKKNIEEFINETQKIIGDRFLSAILHGSCADNSNTKSSDTNLLIVIDKLTAQDLKSLHNAIKKWQKCEKTMPVFMGKIEWFASTDVYPMEYSDIKERYLILYGEDIVSGLETDKCHLRIQCESETKNLLIRLRQGYSANSSDNKVKCALIKSSAKSLVAILKTILRLVSEEKVTNDKYKIIEEVAPQIGLDGEFFANILKFRDDTKIFSQNEYDFVIQKLIDSIYDILKYVDKINTCKEV